MYNSQLEEKSAKLQKSFNPTSHKSAYYKSLKKLQTMNKKTNQVYEINELLSSRNPNILSSYVYQDYNGVSQNKINENVSINPWEDISSQ